MPLTGAGPSIQRAGVMGALNLLAILGGRRSSRLYGLAVAALVTLAIDPSVAGDVGWQLSFAAVLGILAMAAPLAAALRSRLGLRRPLGAALADGLALTMRRPWPRRRWSPSTSVNSRPSACSQTCLHCRRLRR